IVHYLLNRGASINATDSQGLTALHVAASNGFLSIVNILLDRGADQTIKTIESGETPFFTAIRSDEESLAELLKLSPDVNTMTNKGATPLHFACLEAGRLPMVRFLLESGADVHMRDIEGGTPLLWASSTEACKELVKYGAKLDVKTNELVAPLLTLAVQCGMTGIVLSLIEASADVNFIGQHWGSPVHTACQFGRLEILKLLLGHNANAVCIGRGGKTVTMEKAAGNDRKLLDWLREREAGL
ncbi:ankyrin repeat-containing domain protein, partial [Leptodontidium sp. MPI-SDFR-AT-0119]